MPTEIVYYVAASLDGYIAAADGSVEWLTPFQSPEGEKNYTDFYASVDALLMGRRTYEQILGFGQWPYAGKPAYVFAHNKNMAASGDVTVTNRTPAEVAIELRTKNVRRAWLVGGAQLASAFRSKHLISEYIITFMPLLLGSGVPLAMTPGPTERLTLTKTTPLPHGVLQLSYLVDNSAPR